MSYSQPRLPRRVTEDAINHDPLTKFDLGLLDWFHQHASPWGLSIFARIGWLGSATVMAALAILVAVVLTWAHLALLLAVWVAALAGATIYPHVGDS